MFRSFTIANLKNLSLFSHPKTTTITTKRTMIINKATNHIFNVKKTPYYYNYHCYYNNHINYRRFHDINVRDFLKQCNRIPGKTQVFSIRTNDSIKHAAKVMEKNKIGALMVIDNKTNQTTGIITCRDIQRAVAVFDDKRIHTVKIEFSAFFFKFLLSFKMPLFPSKQHNTIQQNIFNFQKKKKRDVMTPECLLKTANLDGKLSVITERMLKNNIRHLPIMDENNNNIDILSVKDVVSCKNQFPFYLFAFVFVFVFLLRPLRSVHLLTFVFQP